MIMMAIYVAIITGSALLFSAALLRLLDRLAKFIGSQWMVLVADAIPALVALAFLMVVAAPAAVLTAALLLFIAGLFNAQRPLSFGLKVTLLLVTAVMGVGDISAMSGSWPAVIPAALAWVAAYLVWLCVSASAWAIQPSAKMFSVMLMASLLPLLPAPLLFDGAHTSLVTDALIISAALAGGMLRWKEGQPALLLLRAPLVFVLACLQVQAVRYGAWPCALGSLAVWIAAVGYAKVSGYSDTGIYVRA